MEASLTCLYSACFTSAAEFDFRVWQEMGPSSIQRGEASEPCSTADADSRASWDHLASSSPPSLVPGGNEREGAQSHTWAPRFAGAQAGTW